MKPFRCDHGFRCDMEKPIKRSATEGTSMRVKKKKGKLCDSAQILWHLVNYIEEINMH